MEHFDNLTHDVNSVTAILDCIGDAISILDRNFKILFQNRAHKDRMGDHNGEPCYKAYHGRTSACEGCPVAVAFEDEKTHRAVRTRQTARGARYVEVTASPLKLKNSAGDDISASVEIVRDITERVAAERQRDESKKMLEDITHGISESILLLAKDRKILWANDAAKRQMGQNVIGEFCYKATHRRDCPCNTYEEPCPLYGSQVYEAPMFVEHTHYDDDGNRFVVEVGAYPVKNESAKVERFVHISRDITERKRAEEALKKYRDHLENLVGRRTAELYESEKRYRLLFENAGDGIFIIDAEGKNAGKIAAANEAAAKMHGYSLMEILELSMGDLHCPGDAKPVSERIGLILKGQWLKAETMHRRKDGVFFPVEISAGLFEQGGHKYIIAIDRDITARKKTEEKIRASLTEKEILLKELYHRTKNNMQVICSLLSLESMAAGDSGLQRVFKETQSRIRAMSLVHERLYKSRDLSNLDIKEYIEDLSGALLESYRDNGDAVRLILDAESLPLSIDLATPCRLIINELLSNSLKYAFPGGRKGEIRIALHKDGNGGIVLTYSDNGVGLPEGLDPRKTKTLGLRLINKLVSGQLKGRLEVRQAGGTEFQINFSRRQQGQ